MLALAHLDPTLKITDHRLEVLLPAAGSDGAEPK
jgi:hypothetical protein